MALLSMSPPCDVKEIAYCNLILLGFSPQEAEAKYKMTFSKDMFDLPNRKGMEVVLHFLFNRMDPSLAKQELRSCWPILDKKQEQVFRKACTNWLSELSKDPATNISRVTASTLMSPSGERFYVLLLHVSTFGLCRAIRQECHSSSGQHLPIPPSHVDQSAATYERVMQAKSVLSCRQFLSNTEKLHVARQRWATYSSDLTDRYRQLSKKLRVLEEDIQRAEVEDHKRLTENLSQLSGVPHDVLKTACHVHGTKAADARCAIRRHNVTELRKLRSDLEGFLSVQSDSVDVLNAVSSRENKENCLSSESAEFRVPDILAKDPSQPLQSISAGQTTLGGEINLQSVVQVCGVAAGKILDDVKKGVPDVSPAAKNMSSLVDLHREQLASIDSLRNQLANEYIPALEKGIRTAKEHVKSGIGTPCKAVFRAGVPKLDLIPASPGFAFPTDIASAPHHVVTPLLANKQQRHIPGSSTLASDMMSRHGAVPLSLVASQPAPTTIDTATTTDPFANPAAGTGGGSPVLVPVMSPQRHQSAHAHTASTVAMARPVPIGMASLSFSPSPPPESSPSTATTASTTTPLDASHLSSSSSSHLQSQVQQAATAPVPSPQLQDSMLQHWEMRLQQIRQRTSTLASTVTAGQLSSPLQSPGTSSNPVRGQATGKRSPAKSSHAPQDHHQQQQQQHHHSPRTPQTELVSPATAIVDQLLAYSNTSRVSGSSANRSILFDGDLSDARSSPDVSLPQTPQRRHQQSVLSGPPSVSSTNATPLQSGSKGSPHAHSQPPSYLTSPQAAMSHTSPQAVMPATAHLISPFKTPIHPRRPLSDEWDSPPQHVALSHSPLVPMPTSGGAASSPQWLLGDASLGTPDVQLVALATPFTAFASRPISAEPSSLAASPVLQQASSSQSATKLETKLQDWQERLQRLQLATGSAVAHSQQGFTAAAAATDALSQGITSADPHPQSPSSPEPLNMSSSLLLTGNDDFLDLLGDGDDRSPVGAPPQWE